MLCHYMGILILLLNSLNDVYATNITVVCQNSSQCTKCDACSAHKCVESCEYNEECQNNECVIPDSTSSVLTLILVCIAAILLLTAPITVHIIRHDFNKFKKMLLRI